MKKRCSACGESKPLSEFNREARRPDGLKIWCRECSKRHKREWHAANKADQNQKTREYYQANGVAIRARRKRNYRLHPERERAWRDTPERKRHRRQTPDGRAATKRQQQRWAEANRERVKEKCRREQAVRWFGAKANKVSYDDVFKRDDGICYLCLKPVERTEAHFDHVIPLVAGGSHTYDNIRPTHPACNMRKGSKIVQSGAYAA